MQTQRNQYFFFYQNALVKKLVQKPVVPVLITFQ